jgi:hypothetical protein
LPGELTAFDYSIAMADRAGFWSYVHADDEADGGRITRLADAIKGEYALLTGQEVDVFVDRKDISWGEEWRRRIDEALEGTAFFIPVITPRYFASEECRRELLTFAGHAKSLGVSELMLPLVYVPVPELNNRDSADEAIALVAKTHYVNWTELRLADDRSQEYRRAVSELAQRLVDISASTSETALPETMTTASPGNEEPPGLIDIMAEAEVAMPRWVGVIEQFPAIFEEIQAATDDTTAQVERLDAAGKGFAGRLVAARQLSQRLSSPAQEILELGTRYASELAAVDAGILTLIRSGQEQDLSDEDRSALCDLFAQIKEVAVVSRANTDQMRELVSILEDTSGLSRELRPPLKKMGDGLRRVADGQAIIDEWVRQIDQAQFECG